MNSIYRADNGYVTLLTVLIVGAASLAIGLTLLLTGTNSQRVTLVSQQSTQARALAAACADEALQQIHDNTSYTGTGTITLATGTCSYTVTSTGASSRVVNTTSTIGNTTRKSQVYVTISASSISIVSWQEVS